MDRKQYAKFSLEVVNLNEMEFAAIIQTYSLTHTSFNNVTFWSNPAREVIYMVVGEGAEREIVRRKEPT